MKKGILDIMDERTLKLLEFDKIFNILNDQCISTAGKNLLRTQDFFTHKKDLDAFKKITGEVKRHLDSGAQFPGLSFPEISPFIRKAEKEGSVLEGEELYSIAGFVDSSIKLKKYFLKGDFQDTRGINALAGEILDLGEIAEKIRAVLDPSGRVKENHPDLVLVRRELKGLRGKVTKLTSEYMGKNREIWQSDVPVLRDGRTVLPLKANYRGRVKGIIHTVSSKGATVFIEPFDILDLNNRIIVTEGEEKIVIRRILRELTTLVTMDVYRLKLLVDQIAYLDTLIARVKYSILYNCSVAENGSERILLKKARHPLLGDSAVPIDVEIERNLNTLIITGPNAGGKTVTLKTSGLFALMNQFGMDIPAESGSVMEVFDGVFADLGDDQSLEDSLSTFSGHMKKISFILDKASRNSLVLLDELGSGTDPAEGASIAMAVLDSFNEMGSLVITTSHHGLLKNYAYTREHVSNASMEFDFESHTPTYRVIFGIPGESHAIEIAKKSGLPVQIVEKAEKYMHSGQSDISEMIKELERKQRELYERERTLKKDIKKYDLKLLELRQRENIVHREGYRSLDKFIRESRKTLENLVREIREGELTKEKKLRVKKYIASLEERLAKEDKSLKSRSFSDADRVSGGNIVLKEGMEVEVGQYRRKGTLLRREKNGNWLVAAGAVKMSFPVSDIYPLKISTDKKPSYSVSVSGVLADNSPSFILDIRGQRADEALKTITMQLDRAVMSGMREFAVIHGKGEGTLSSVVNEVLKNSNQVLEFGFAKPEEGGFGKTIVRLKGTG